MSGLAWSTGAAADPVPVGCAAADQHGAALLALGIVGAYAKWLRTGEGTRVEATLLGAGIDLQMESLVTYFARGAGCHEGFRRDPHLATWFHEAPYGVYRITDGHVALSMNPPRRLAEALRSETLLAFDGRNVYEERDAFARAVAEELRLWCFADLAEAFDAAGVWYARVADYDDVAQNPQLAHNEAFREIAVNGETLRVLNHPLRYDGKTPGEGAYALAPGADTRRVLGEAGFADAEIAELLRDGIAAAAD
jgi:crotonobetainyl-CoA:carnitine CoA-transferase CaiB-like acyl-CoA transferase